MSKIRKTRYFEFTAVLLVFLFIFQADFLLAVNNKTDHEKQYELAKRDVDQRKYENAIIRLERLKKVLDSKKQKSLLKKINLLLKKIETLKKSQRYKRNVIEKSVSRPKKKKKSPVLLILAGLVTVGVGIYLLVRGLKKPKTANINISFSTNPVYIESDGYWRYSVILTETNGVGVTLTRMEYSPGTWYGGGIVELFGTDFISANGTLSSNIVSWGYSDNSKITFTFWGDDANGHKDLKWSGTVTLRKSSSNQSLSTFSFHGYNKGGSTAVKEPKR